MPLVTVVEFNSHLLLYLYLRE